MVHPGPGLYQRSVSARCLRSPSDFNTQTAVFANQLDESRLRGMFDEYQQMSAREAAVPNREVVVGDQHS